jgi:hypothetical protein
MNEKIFGQKVLWHALYDASLDTIAFTAADLGKTLLQGNYPYSSIIGEGKFSAVFIGSFISIFMQYKYPSLRENDSLIKIPTISLIMILNDIMRGFSINTIITDLIEVGVSIGGVDYMKLRDKETIKNEYAGYDKQQTKQPTKHPREHYYII